MDKIEELYNLYLENGLISDATHIDVFRAASPEQREKLYNLGVQKGIFETTTLGDFNRPWFESAGGAEKFVDVLESVKKKDTGVLESPSEPGFSVLSDLTDEEIQDRASETRDSLIPTQELERIAALEQEANQYPAISRKRGELQSQVDDIRSQYQPQLGDVTDKTNYEIIKESLSDINAQIEEITNKYDAVARQQEPDPFKASNLKNQLVESDGNLQYLKRQKELYDQDNFKYEKAIEELSKDTGGNVGTGNLLKSIAGVFYSGDEIPWEIVEYSDEFKERLIRSIGDERELERLIGGRMSLEKKEQIIFRAKIDFIQEKQREAQQIISDPNATTEEKKKAIDKLALSYFDAGWDVFDGRFKNMFKSSEDARNFKELATKTNIPFVEELFDLVGTFGQAVYETAAGYVIQAPAELMASGYNGLYSLFGGKDKYTSADKFIDSMERFTTFQVLPSSEEQGMLLDDNGEFNLSLYGASKGVLETLPFTLSILAAMKRGKFKLPDNSNMITRLVNSRKDPKKAYETYKLITTSYRTALSQSMRDAREQGLSGTDAAVYGNAHALMEGITNTIMPDTAYFRTVAGRGVLQTFLGSLKTAANKQARGKAIKDFITTITKEIGEEEAMALYEDIAKAYTFTDSKLFAEFTDINRQKQLLTVTVGLSGGLGGVRIPSAIRQAKADIYNDIAKSADQLMAMVDDEIAMSPERSQELEKVRTYISDVARAVETSPENVTFEEVDLLTQKLNIQREMESVDEAFRGPYKDKIQALNERIVEAAKSYTVDVTADEATQALEDEGITNPTMGEVIKKQNELIKEKEEALNEGGLPTQQNKTKKKLEDLFGKTHSDKRLPSGKAEIKNITDVDENGVATATYINPETGSEDVILTAKDGKNFVGYVRVYENGKPTNKWSAKMESTGGAFKNMITTADAALPDGARVIETTTISEGGLRSFNKSNLDVETDADGNVVTNTTSYSDATQESVEEKGNAAYDAFQTDDKAKAEAEVEKIKKAYPGIEVKIKRQGTNRGKKTYTIDVELPVLIKSNNKTKVDAAPKQETNQQEIDPLVEDKKKNKQQRQENLSKDIVSNDIESFANRIIEGGIDDFSPEALQFYAENKEVLDQLIRSKQKEAPKTASKERSLATRIADGQTEFTAAEIDLFAANAEAIRAEVDAIANTRGIEITSDTYKNILESTKSPTAKDVVTERVNKLRKEFWSGWNKSWRESNLDSKQKKKDLLKQIKDAVSKGQITPAQQRALINKIANVNLDNPIARRNLVDYAGNLFESAEYKAKINKAKSLNTRIRKARNNAEATVAKSAKDFLSIDPSKVENIDEHLAIAENLLEGLRPTREALSADGNLKVREAADITAANEYISAAQKTQAKIKEAKLNELFEEATGQSSEQFSVAEMKEMLATIDTETTEQTIEDKKDTIKKAAKNAFEVYAESVFASLADPSIPTKTKNLVNEFLNIDVDGLSNKQALKALDALVNFNENNTATGGMQSIVEVAKANKKAKEIASENIPSRNLNTIGKIWSKKITTLPLLFENIFVTQRKARKVSDAIGVTDYQNQAAKAETDAQNFVDRYARKFNTNKNKPNKKAWNDATNIYERGMYAFVNRTVDGDVQSQENEFNRRKGLIEQSIVDLRDAGEAKKADLYQEVYDKVLANATNRDQLNVDPINKASVEFFANEWANVYPELSDVALNVYNRALEADLNYTTDNLSKLKVDDQKTVDLNEPGFNEDHGTTRVYDKQSGTLIESKRPTKLKNRYVNLDFDSQNSMRLKEALTDVYSAGTVQYMNGFINSDAYKQIVPDADTRDLLTERIKNLVDIKRNKQFTTKSQAKLNKTLNRLATIGTGRVLGGIAQFPKQLIPPIINTISQAGPINMLKGIGMMFNPSVNRFLDNSGMSIANRGAQSQTSLESVSNKLEANLEGNAQKGLGVLAKPNEFLLKGLVKGDKIAARASWMAYYLDGLQKQKVNTDGINWNTHEINQEAANFAQQQVDRNQNVSDPDLQGEVFTSKKTGYIAVRKIVLPFATFILNQKTRMVNDVRAVTSKTASAAEKGDAARSLSGLLTEQAAFHTMGYFITNMLTELAYDLIGELEPEEDKKKRLANMFKGKKSTLVKDFISPIPPLDDSTTGLINIITDAIASGEENPLELFADNEKDLVDQLGTLGIGIDKASKLSELILMATTGTYTENNKTKELTGLSKAKVEDLVLPYLLYNLGLLPSEAGTIIEKMMRVAKKIKPPKAKPTPLYYN